MFTGYFLQFRFDPLTVQEHVVEFPNICGISSSCAVQSLLYSMVIKNDTYDIHLLKFVKTCSVDSLSLLENILYVTEKVVYSALAWWSGLYMCIICY